MREEEKSRRAAPTTEKTTLVGVVGTIDRVAGAEKAYWAISSGLRERLDLDLVQMSQLEPDDSALDGRESHGLRTGYSFFGLGQFLRLRELLAGVRRPALIFSFQINPNILSVIANKLLPPHLRLPVIVNDRANIRVLTAPDPELGRIWAIRMIFIRWLARYSYRRAEEIICNSKANARQVREFVGPSGPPVTAIYNPVAVEEIQSRFPDRDRSNFTLEGRPLIVGHGRLYYGKGWRTLIRAFAKICEEFPKARLRLVGDGELRSVLEALAVEMGVFEQCEFPGHSSDPLSEVEPADVYVLASRSEGMPNSLLEAIALGLPCVSTDCLTGPEEILGRDGSIGRLIPVGGEGEMVKAILELLRDGSLRTELSRAARSRALDFRLSNCIDGYEEVVRKYLP